MPKKDRAFKKNLLGHTNKLRTICEVLREIYWAIEDPDTRLKVVEASMMAKKMSRKIAQNEFELGEAMDYEAMSEENKKKISKERWKQYLEELEEGVDHPMNERDK
jgi:hypothetical protein